MIQRHIYLVKCFITMNIISNAGIEKAKNNKHIKKEMQVAER